MIGNNKLSYKVPTPTVQISSEGFHMSWVCCFFLLILMTCQTHSDPQVQDVLMMTACAGAKNNTLLQEDLAAL